MLEVLAPIKDLLLRNEEPVRLDNIVFRLHSQFTVLLLSACAVIISAKQFVGDPISCMNDGSLDMTSVNAYCWIYSTFTVKRHLRGVPGRQVASAGVAQALSGDEILRHRYYQWVCLVLVIQAAAFYVPRALWHAWEGGLINSLARDLNTPFARDVWTADRHAKIIGYLADRKVRRGHDAYALKYLACELFNLVNTISQMYLLDLFLEGQFHNYGALVSGLVDDESEPFERVDPMARLFPILTKCTIHSFGPGGSSQTHDALCVLPLNLVNEKVFVLVWFWLVFLAVAGALAIVYRLAVLTQRRARYCLLLADARGSLSRGNAELLTRTLSYGDCFVLRLIAKNSNPLVYRLLVIDLAGGLEKAGDVI